MKFYTFKAYINFLFGGGGGVKTVHLFMIIKNGWDPGHFKDNLQIVYVRGSTGTSVYVVISEDPFVPIPFNKLHTPTFQLECIYTHNEIYTN